MILSRPGFLARIRLPKNPWVINGARIGFGALAVYLLIRTGALKPELLGKAIVSHPFLYAFAFVLYFFVVQIVASVRWYWLLRSADVTISLWEVIRLHMVGLFFGGFLPGGTGGDLVKAYYLMRGRSRAKGAAALGTLFVDRITGLFGLITLATLAALANVSVWRGSKLLGAQSAIILCAAAAAALVTLAYLSPWKPRWMPEVPREGEERGFLSQLAGALTAFRRHPGVFLGAIAISVSVHFLLVVIYVLCAQALNVELPFRLHAYVVPTLTFVNGIPISPAGLGVGEAAGMVLYKAVGATHGQAEIPALVHTLALIIALLSAPFYFLGPRVRAPQAGAHGKPRSRGRKRAPGRTPKTPE